MKLDGSRSQYLPGRGSEKNVWLLILSDHPDNGDIAGLGISGGRGGPSAGTGGGGGGDVVSGGGCAVGDYVLPSFVVNLSHSLSLIVKGLDPVPVLQFDVSVPGVFRDKHHSQAGHHHGERIEIHEIGRHETTDDIHQ